jgi:hypothetical protein
MDRKEVDEPVGGSGDGWTFIRSTTRDSKDRPARCRRWQYDAADIRRELRFHICLNLHGRLNACSMSSMHEGAAIDDQGLAGDEVAVGRGEERDSADDVFRHLLAG